VFSRVAPGSPDPISSVPFRISWCNPPARTRAALESSLFGFNLCIWRSKLSSFWVRFPNAPCVFNNILASFVLFLCFSESCLPSSLAKFRGREIDESGSLGMAHRLPKLRPERSGRRLASQLLDSLTPRPLDCTWRQKPQAGTTDENKRGLSGIAYWQGRTACPTPPNNSSLCCPVCQVKNVQEFPHFFVRAKPGRVARAKRRGVGRR